MKHPAYSKYKSSGIEWLGEVPEHWEVKAIKWESPVLRGASPRPIDNEIYFDEEGEYAWVRIADVSAAGMYLRETTQKLSELGQSLSVPLQPGALFLSIAGSVGKPCITSIKCCIHDGFVYFPFWRGDPRFLYYLFASGEPYKGLGKLGTQLNLNTDTVGSIVAGFPSPVEQHTIADFLDRETAKIDTLVAKKRTLIERLKEKRSALISRTVTRGLPPDAARAAGLDSHPKLKPSGIDWLGDVPEHWEVKRLKHIVTAIEQGWSPDCDSAPAVPDEWGVLKAGCCNGGVFVPEENKTLPADLDAPPRLEIQPGDILMSRASGSEDLVGSAALVPENTRSRLLLSDKTYRLQCDVRKIVPALLARLLQSPLGRVQIQAFISGASGLAKNIAQSDVKELLFPIPPFAEQRVIADFLDRETAKVDAMVRKVETAIERLQEYRTALITAAVTGKIDVRGNVARQPEPVKIAV